MISFRRIRSVLASATAVLVLGACAGAGSDAAGEATTTTTPGQRAAAAGTTSRLRPAARLLGSGTVLESAAHGPELCFQVLTSLPPQCGGVPLVGWDWAAAPGGQEVGGTRWVDGVVVVGTFDGTSLLVENVAPTPQDPPAPPSGPPACVAGDDPCRPGGPTLRQLEAVAAEVFAELRGRGEQHASGGVDAYAGVVRVSVLVVDPEHQALLDDRHGAGTVVLEGLLRPA